MSCIWAGSIILKSKHNYNERMPAYISNQKISQIIIHEEHWFLESLEKIKGCSAFAHTASYFNLFAIMRVLEVNQ